MKKIVLGPEHDQSLQRVVKSILSECGVTNIEASWGVGGSQEYIRLECLVWGEAVCVESETYMGLTISGPTQVVERLAALVNERIGKEQ